MTTPKKPRRFVILSSGRSGSNLLCQALSEHPSVLAFTEPFCANPNDRPSINDRVFSDGDDPIEFLTTTLWEPSTKPVVGFKLFFHQLRANATQVETWKWLAANPDIKKIILRRDNLLDIYISEARAKRSGVWHLSGTRDSEERAKYNKEQLWLDCVACKTYMDDLAAGYMWLASTFPDAVTVTYDEMALDLPSVTDRLFKHLGVPSFAISSKFEPLTTLPHHVGIGNWDELRDWIGLTIYADFLPDADGVNTARAKPSSLLPSP
jgi:hypothetical protein